MLSPDVVLNIVNRSRDVSIQNVTDHSAMSDGLRILAVNESQHAMGNIFGGIWTGLTILDDVQALTFQAKVDFLTRVQGLEYDVLPSEFLAR